MSNKLSVGVTVVLDTAKIPSIPWGDGDLPRGPLAQARVQIRGRARGNARAWLVRILPYTHEFELSSTIINRHSHHAPSVGDACNEADDDDAEPQATDSHSDGDYSDDDDSFEEDDPDTDDDSSSELAPTSSLSSLPAQRPDRSHTLLQPHGQRWYSVSDGDVLADPRTIEEARTKLLWSEIGLSEFGVAGVAEETLAHVVATREPWHYLLLALPTQLFHGIVARTNANIAASKKACAAPPFTVQRLLVLIGLIYGKALSDQCQHRDYWRHDDDDIAPYPNFGRFMLLSHFEFVQTTHQLVSTESKRRVGCGT